MHKLKQLFKYTGLACLALVFLAFSSIRNNAFPLMGKVALAEQVTDEVSNNNTSSSYLSLSVTSSSSSSSTGSDNPNLYLQAPEGGGIVTGWHTLSVSVLNVGANYTITMYASNKEATTSMLPSSSVNTTKLASIAGSNMSLSVNTWGYSLTKPDATSQATLKNEAIWSAIPSSTSPDTIVDTATLKNSSVSSSTDASSSSATASHTIYYGVKTDNLTQADTYSTTVTYTVTADLLPLPIVTTVNGSTAAEYTIGSDTDSTIAIAGSNLSTVNTTNGVYIDLNDNGTLDSGEECISISIKSDTLITCKVPTASSDGSTLTATSHNLYVENDGGTAKQTNAVTYVEPSICKGSAPASGSTSVDGGDCQIDIDANMIPIVYAGSTDNAKWVKAGTNTVTDSDGNTWNSWFDYSNKQWANAVTVAADKLEAYQSADAGTEISEDDVLGYWVYIPRYSYEVMRRDAVDKVVQAQNFNIRFEKATDTKKEPIAGCTTDTMLVESLSTAKDYRTECSLNRTYPDEDASLADSTTWATHPAFTWQYTTEVNGFDKTIELNGIWIGKFETTGSIEKPTVLPNEKHITTTKSSATLPFVIGNFYDVAKSMGTLDDNNVGGNNTSVAQNNQNLEELSSTMLRNLDWGAVAYLANSMYGAPGTIGANTQIDISYDGNGNQSVGITGCGAANVGLNSDTYNDIGNIGTQTACSQSESQRAYNGSIGQHSSATYNIYGIYDMSGGAWEYTAGALTYNESSMSNLSKFNTSVVPPYINLYSTYDGFESAREWSLSTDDYYYNSDSCTFETCGGQALFETKRFQALSSGISSMPSWGNASGSFVCLIGYYNVRGGLADNHGNTGIYYHAVQFGAEGNGISGFRVILYALQ